MPDKPLSAAEKRMGHSFDSPAHKKMQRELHGRPRGKKKGKRMSERLGVKQY